MKRIIPAIIILVSSVFISYSRQYNTTSPDGNILISFRLNSAGTAQYSVSFKGSTFINWSDLGLKFKEGGLLSSDLKIVSADTKTIDETYPIVSGISKYGRDHCNETKISVEEKSGEGRKLDLYFRAYNDGAAFRYGIPQQSAINDFIIETEETFFNFAGDYDCWAIKKAKFRNSYEDGYVHYNVSNMFSENDGRPYTLLPVTFHVNDNLYFSFTEASLINYAGMYLIKNNSRSFKSKLSPDSAKTDISVRGKTPALTPWRVFIIGSKPGTLAESNILMSLCEPSKLRDVSWIKPGKTTWSWWAEDRGFDPSFGYQILANKTVQYYIDFAASNSIQYVILDGGWYGWFDATKDDAKHDITKSLPELDLPAMSKYAESKGIGLILWVVWYELERQFDEALDYYQSLGIKGIKMDFMDRDDQYMVDFYQKVAEGCAKRKMFVMYHGAFKPNGVERTYPNILSYEAVMGNEFNRWDAGVTTNPDYNTVLPFTRLIAGPMDYTPGSFTNVTKEQYKAQWKNPMTLGTRAQQLAMFVVYQSGIVSLCESPKIYEKYPEFSFIKQVPATWDSTIVLGGEIGEYIVMARKKGNDWFVGAMSNWDDREIDIDFSFVEAGSYECIVYADGENTQKYPERVKISNIIVSKSSQKTFQLANGGGLALILKKK